jgi:pyrimidine-nucleoside phosphorylase
MNIVEIINKKRLKKHLTREEIEFVINGYIKEEIKDYQMSSLLMAICLNGMNKEETAILTEVMYKSGDVIDLSNLRGHKIDKHSTGGVGDKTTLIVLPLVASCGVIAPKMSGRGLGFTGGTIDKLESIPGFNTSIKIDDFIKQVNNIGLALASQTGNLVPADKKIYALRDVTGTVESIPLIASSIMSKKLASGADTIVIDLKVGNGALMKDLESARKLANAMVSIGKAHKRNVICVLTDMNQPLGNAIGNALEVKEAMDCLLNKGPDDITNLSIVLSSVMVSYGLQIDFKRANKMVLENLRNGSAYKKFEQLVQAQGGDLLNIKVADTVVSVKSKETGFISHIETDALGEIVRKLGGGRYEKEDNIDHSVGIVLSKKIGDYVMEDEEILKIYASDKNVVIDEVLDCFKIEMLNKNHNNLIIEMIR